MNVYRFQGHALTDALDRCTGGIPLSGDYNSEWTKVPCPLCLDWFKFEDLDEDHAPQKAGQSQLGPAQVLVMTCREHNTTAGGSFERTAARLGSILTAVGDPLCPVHQHTRTTASGLHVAADPASFQLTDVRAAFLVAFAALGYSWVASPRLDRLRHHLAAGDLSFATTDYDLICDHSGTLQPFKVYEVEAPVTAVVVTGAHAAVVLPAHGSPNDISGKVSQPIKTTQIGDLTVTDYELKARITRQVGWPRAYVGQGREVELAWDDIHDAALFHYDRCDEPGSHQLHRLSSEQLRDSFGQTAISDAAARIARPGGPP